MKSSPSFSTRQQLLTWVEEGTPTVVAFQRLCGVTRDNVNGAEVVQIQRSFLYYLFTAAAALGNELFYILFFPALFWVYDSYVARRVIYLWVVDYYLGQAIKDTLRLPRPPEPPVVRIEHHYETEYGLPSTHAMAAVSIPYYILFCSRNCSSVGLAIAFVWSVSMSLSRLYMGVHTIIDILTGIILGVGVLSFFMVTGDDIDAWFISSSVASFVVPSIAIVCVILYPRPQKWTNAYGDTALIVGVGVGVFFGSGLNIKFLSQAYSGDATLVWWASFALLRCTVGFAVMFSTRLAVKKMLFQLITPIFISRVKKDDLPQFNPNRMYATEIPCKFVTYGTLGFNATFTVPLLFQRLGI